MFRPLKIKWLKFKYGFFKLNPFFKKLGRRIYPFGPHYHITVVPRLKLDLQEYEYRREFGRSLSKGVEAQIIDPPKGYGRINKTKLPGVADVVRACRLIIQEKGLSRETAHTHEFSNEATQKANKSAYFFNILHPDDVFRHPELMDFILSESLISQVCVSSDGILPRLCDVGLMVSPVNDLRKGSQNWHFDPRVNPVKLFLNIFDVGEDDGPLMFFPADKSEEIMNSTPYRDEALLDQSALDEMANHSAVRGIGPAGNGLLFQTSRCAHAGSRVKRRNRIVLLVHYAIFMNYNWQPGKGLKSTIWMKDHPELREAFSTNELRSAVLKLDPF